MAPSAARCIFVVARLGGFVVACLALVGLNLSFSAVHGGQNDAPSDSLESTSQKPFLDQKTKKLEAAPSANHESARIDSKTRSIVVAETTTTTELIAASPMLKTSNAHCKGESFYSLKGGAYFPAVKQSARGNASKLAILFRGEAFRSKMKAGAERRIKNQMEASESHVTFLLRGLREAGLQVDIFAFGSVIGDVELSDAEARLKELYSPFGKTSMLLKAKKFVSQGDGYMEALRWFQQRTKSPSAKDVPYDFVFILRFDIVFTSSAVPPLSRKSLVYTHILYAMRDADFGWKSLAYVHDSMQWIPKKHFKQFFDNAAGHGGCYERSKNWYAGSGHGCWLIQQRVVQQGFFHEGCFAVKDTHPMYYLTEMRRKR